MTVLFTAADLAEMRAENDANLPHSVVIEQGVVTFEPGGTRSGIVWAIEPVATEPCRISPASAPQERLSAGAITEIKLFYVVMRVGASVPQNTADGLTFYRLRVTHDIAGFASPLTLYLVGTPGHSFEMERKVLCTTEAPQ